MVYNEIMSIENTPRAQAETTGATPPTDDATSQLVSAAIGRFRAVHIIRRNNKDAYNDGGWVVTAQVSVMNGFRDEEGRAWTVSKRYADGGRSYPGEEMSIEDGDPKRSVVLDEDGNPVRVDYFRTTGGDVSVTSAPGNSSGKHDDMARRVAEEAAGLKPRPDFVMGPDVGAPHISVSMQD